MMSAQLPAHRVTALDDAHIIEAIAAARTSGRRTVEALEDIAQAANGGAFMAGLGMALALPVLNMASLRAMQLSFERLSFADCSRKSCLAGNLFDKLVVVISDPFDIDLQHWLDGRFGSTPIHLAHSSDIAARLSSHEDTMRAMHSQYIAIDEGSPDPVGISLASIADDQSSTVRLVNSTIYDAIKLGASDIHIESTARGLAIKFRIDGVLESITQMAGIASAQEVVSRIKVMAELDISERRTPQDGRFKLAIQGREVDFRVSVMPSVHGEDIVVRILDKQYLSDQLAGLRLDKLGFDPTILAQLRKLSREPYGMLLVTGPTGSGKTTTLYAAVSEIFTGRDKIITIEDPVEYQLPGILQIPVNEKKGLTFARGLRSILRHDPDKILVGEIRDNETAQIAIQSALTGHLVFTSVHANNVLDVLGRFAHMGVDPYSFMSALNGILAQRLLRLNCEACAEPIDPAGDSLAAAGISSIAAKPMRFMAGKGCGQCRGTGYRGRFAIGELLILTDALREMIVGRAPVTTLKEVAKQNGTRFLRESALALVSAGRTTLDEIGRVTFSD